MEDIDNAFNDLLFYGTANGMVFVTINGKRKILNIEITPNELYSENADRLHQLVLEATASANEKWFTQNK